MNPWALAAVLAAAWLAPLPALAQADAATATTAPADPPEAPPTAAPAETAETFPWTASCELGFSLSEGNSSTRNLNGNCLGEYEKHHWLLRFTGGVDYSLARYGGRGPVPRGDFVVSENDWLLKFRQERRFLTDDRLFAYLIELVGSDPFSGYWLRKQADLGAGFAYIATADHRHSVEGGFQVQQDDLTALNVDGEERENRFAAVAGLAGESALNSWLLWTYETAYSVDLSEPEEDYRIDGQTAFSFAINSWLSYKVRASVIYDNQPALVQPLDQGGSEIPGAAPVPAKETDVTFSNLLVLTLL